MSQMIILFKNETVFLVPYDRFIMENKCLHIFRDTQNIYKIVSAVYFALVLGM
jgi:hypothetical protein